MDPDRNSPSPTESGDWVDGAREHSGAGELKDKPERRCGSQDQRGLAGFSRFIPSVTR